MSIRKKFLSARQMQNHRDAFARACKLIVPRERAMNRRTFQRDAALRDHRAGCVEDRQYAGMSGRDEQDFRIARERKDDFFGTENCVWSAVLFAEVFRARADFARDGQDEIVIVTRAICDDRTETRVLEFNWCHWI